LLAEKGPVRSSGGQALVGRMGGSGLFGWLRVLDCRCDFSLAWLGSGSDDGPGPGLAVEAELE
jgi:hypothetical protein